MKPFKSFAGLLLVGLAVLTLTTPVASAPAGGAPHYHPFLGVLDQLFFHGAFAATRLYEDRVAEINKLVAQEDALQKDADSTTDAARRQQDLLTILFLLDHVKRINAEIETNAPASVSDEITSQYTAPPPPPTGQTVYDASQCIGAVVMGVCHGTVNPAAPPLGHATDR